MKKALLLSALISLSLLMESCESKSENAYPTLWDDEIIPADLGLAGLKYDSVFATKYGFENPFLKIKDEFYSFGDYYLQLVKYNLNNDSWLSNFTYSTDHYLSSGKYFFTEGDSIVMVSYFNQSNKLDIYSIQSDKLTVKLLKKDLFLNERIETNYQSTFLWDKNRIIILVHPADKILVIDTKDFTVKSLIDTHLNEIRHHASLASVTVWGKSGRDVYLYYYSYKKLFRLNLDSYLFSEIPVPKYLTSLIAPITERVGLVGNYFTFWPIKSQTALCYDIAKGSWLKGGNNPFYNNPYNSLNGFSDESGFYYINNSTIMRISVK